MLETLWLSLGLANHAELFRDHPFLDLKSQSDLVRQALDEVSSRPS